MKSKVSFPEFGSYGIAMEHLITKGLDMDYVFPPPMTRRTLETGSRYSPDAVCAPFKLNLGSFIEAIEAGADTLIQVGGACRLGYYGELHEQILSDLGYQVRFVNLARGDYSKPATFLNEFKKINPNLSLPKVVSALAVSLKMVECMDTVDSYVRRHVGFERESGTFDQVHRQWLEELRWAESAKDVKALCSVALRRMKAIPLNRPKKPLRVGVVGEYYTIMDPFSNHDLEKALAGMGIFIDRWMNVSNSLFRYKDKKMLPSIRGYASYNMGATAMGTIDSALHYAKAGYDGIIHVKSFGCTPETDAITVLQNISSDFKIPILYLSYDSQTSDTGLQTRLEAFYDMISMRKGL